jgi:D-alanyl-D-alanine carboxypeptidase (penicillin-binding protein 5/6)
MVFTRRQIYRRRRIAVFGGLAFLLAAGFYLPFTLLAPVSPVSAVVVPWDAPVTSDPTLSFPSYGASGIGAIGYDGVLASAGTSGPLPIASITKVITALTVLDVKPLTPGEAGPDITFSDVDERFYTNQVAQDGVVEPAAAGQVMSEGTMLTVMLMASANNYADSVAHWAFGSEPAYLDAARAWLASNGFTATTVTDPSGIESTNVSNVADLVHLATLALQNPVVAQIVDTATLDVPNIGTVVNRNELLGIDGVNGIKTGTLDESGACLLFSAKETIGTDTVTLVGVVLGGPDHPTVAANVQSLLAEAVAGFHEVTLTTIGEQFARYSTRWGDSAAAVATMDQSVLVWSALPITLAVEATPVRLAGAASSVGSAVFTVGERVFTVPLALSASIDDPGAWWRLTNPARLS